MENVKNNNEKYYSYKTQIEKYNRAMQEGFYYEAIFISYAIMEDRLLSFLDKTGVITLEKALQTKKLEMTEKIKPFIYYLTKSDNINLQNITEKIKIIKCMLKMSYEDATAFETKYRTEMNTDCMNGYLQDLYMDIDENIDRDAVKKHFNKMKKWFEKRNNLIHGLVNKTADDDFEMEIKMIANDSEKIWRYIDNNLVSKMKNCKLREKYKI